MVDVVVSPSSQTANQYSGGATGVIDSESRWMRELADILTPLLKALGLTVTDLRSTDLYTRIQQSNKIGPLLHLAVHSNAGGGHGSGFYIYGRGGKSEPIAAAMAAAMAPVTPTNDDGVRVYNHYETRTTTSPAVIAEVEFHDNVTDAQWIRTHLPAIAVGLARGVVDGLAAAYGGRFVELAKRPVLLPGGGGGMSPIVVVKPTPVPSVPAPAASKAWPDVALIVDGDRGPVTVKAWQKLLAGVGKYTGRIDGQWGPMSVKASQVWLKGLGYYSGWIDGDEGSMTITALQKFLASKGLYRGRIDGRRGPVTVTAEQKYLNDQRKHF